MNTMLEIKERPREQLPKSRPGPAASRGGHRVLENLQPISTSLRTGWRGSLSLWENEREGQGENVVFSALVLLWS